MDGPTLTPPALVPHYYGDIVRKLFLAAGVIILLALPFIDSLLPLPATILLLVVLATSVVAGLTNPKQLWVMVLDIAVALIGIIAFEGHAITRSDGDPVWVFVVDQVLALLFFFALYFSIKSLRGRMVPDERSGEPTMTAMLPPEDEPPRGASGLMG